MLIPPTCSGKPSFISELLYKQHIILTHLYPRLPTKGPLPPCTRLQSRSEFSNHFLSQHYTDLTLLSQPPPRPPPRLDLPTAPPTSPQCAVVTPYHPDHDHEVVEEDMSVQQPEASNRVMRTIHNTSRMARAKVRKNWEDSSLNAQKV